MDANSSLRVYDLGFTWIVDCSLSSRLYHARAITSVWWLGIRQSKAYRRWRIESDNGLGSS